RTVATKKFLRHLQSDGVNAESLCGVNSGCFRCWYEVKVFERSECGQIEDRSQVDKEGLVPLASEHLRAIVKRLHRRIRQVRITRSRSRPNIHRWSGQVLGEKCCFAFSSSSLNSCDSVDLLHIPGRVVQGSYLAGVIQKSIRVPNLSRERKLVGYIFNSIAVVINHYFVQYIVPECVEVEAASRLLH